MARMGRDEREWRRSAPSYESSQAPAANTQHAPTHRPLPHNLSQHRSHQIPWLETPIIYDVRAKPRNIASLTGTKDLQMVNITCRVLSRPAVDDLPVM